MWNTYDKQYSLFTYKNIDWDKSKQIYRELAINASDDDELFKVLSNMLKPLNDAHVWLSWYENNKYFNSSDTSEITLESWYFNPLNIEGRYTETLKKTASDIVYYGKVNERNIGYIYLSSLSKKLNGLTNIESWVYDVDKIIDEYMDTDALIIDIRGNEGGFRANAEHIASRLVKKRKIYAKSKSRIGLGHNEFGTSTDFYINPRGIIYDKPIYLITNKKTMSAGELLTLMLKTSDNVIHLGWTTRGATGYVNFHNLPNGWEFSTTIGYLTDEKGICYEGLGIEPDVEFKGAEPLSWIIKNTKVNSSNDY